MGDEGVVIKSTTGGQTWTDVNEFNRVTDALGNPASLHDIFMIDNDHGIAVGLDGSIVETSNGWIGFTTPPNLPGRFAASFGDPDDAYDVHLFRDTAPDEWTRGVIAAEYGKIWHLSRSTSTAPWTFTEISVASTNCPPLPGHNLEMWAVSFEDPLDSTSAGWAVGGVTTNTGYVFQTSGGGAPGTGRSRPASSGSIRTTSPIRRTRAGS